MSEESQKCWRFMEKNVWLSPTHEVHGSPDSSFLVALGLSEAVRSTQEVPDLRKPPKTSPKRRIRSGVWTPVLALLWIVPVLTNVVFFYSPCCEATKFHVNRAHITWDLQEAKYAEFLLTLGLLYIGTTLGSKDGCHAGSVRNLQNSNITCKAEEREALLKFNQGLGYPLDNWETEEDCCKWEEIECSEQTGNVVKLDLSDTHLSQNRLVELHNLDWLSNLSSLRHLDLGGVNLSQVVNWPGQVDMLPSLQVLYLSDCGLSMPQISSAISLANFTSPLSILHLSSNNLDSFVFHWLSKYTNLLVLDLSNNSLEGVIPELTQFPLLRELYLSNNQLNGSLTEIIGKLSNLQVLDVNSNYLGVITEAHFSNLSMLSRLDLFFNSLSLKLSTSWVPPFSLNTIGLGSCKLGPAFPPWLRTQRNFQRLEMSSAGISDTIPNWFWDLSPVMNFVNLSHNEIQGTIPSQWLSGFVGYPILDMSHNRFNGLLPSLHPDSTVLDLSNNLFQGSITSFCEKLSVSSNLKILDLSHNSLFGEIPENCFSEQMMRPLILLNLANNNFTGRIPDSIGSRSSALRILQLQNNLFTGELPGQLMNCRDLALLDVGGNKLSGRIPEWIGMRLENVVVLRLSSNSFNGSIPVNLCHLQSLQILDLSNNNITGTLPRCLNNFICMTEKECSSLMLGGSVSIASCTAVASGIIVGAGNHTAPIEHDALYWHSPVNVLVMNHIANLFVIIKGQNREFDKTLILLKLIDLASNKLEGEIPNEITSLSGLIGLNLAKNLLSGTIPESIGGLKNLDFLDLSRNQLSGTIPPSLANLGFLGYLDLANNNLSGKIPTGAKLQGFNASVYAGNHLCGLPLPTKCGDEPITPPSGGKHGDDANVQEHGISHDKIWLYSSIALGFIVGFWGVCGSLVLKSSWRCAYFQSVENIRDKLYVTVVVSVAKLRRNFETN